ncbi:MAG TPA: UDP-N-acetylglucosamine 2-epimerase (non-hydrolyzing) [Beijerinckiaceae bacterium]|nr:UDP-N-acetylglucosamine 2-epimerase (non-hydrolyzing) [Beijerinckiaceae bacterium]
MLASVVGNRPQLIKMAPVSAELVRRGVDEYIIHSGQHYDENMSGIFFRELGIPAPRKTLGVTEKTHGRMTAEMLQKLEDTFLEVKPDALLIYGDTNTTLAAALAAVKLHIPMAHVEAGPRLYDIDTPEEINRIVADHASRIRFCPDDLSVDNLRKENITANVYKTGDLMFDAFREFTPIAARESKLLQSLGLDGSEPFAFVTVHRPNNTDSPQALHNLLAFVRESPMPVLFAVHPRTRAACERNGLWDELRSLPQARIAPAIGYIDVLAVLQKTTIVITDSGGLQKESYFAGKPAIVLFHATPWPYLEEVGWLRHVGCLDELRPADLADLVRSFRPQGPRPEFFGDGFAARKVADILKAQGWI